jgi:hypothetical protein
MQALSLAWGILALLGFLIGFIPCLGALNWINIPFALVGLIVSVIAHNKATPDKKSMAMAGIVMCAIAAIIGYFRLQMGGGIL